MEVFSFAQLFYFSLTHLAVWEEINTGFVLYNGGLNTLSASLAEMASIQPVAGAQYHWTYHLTPSIRRSVTWIQGWSTWFGHATINVSLLAGIANVTILLLEAMIQLNFENYLLMGVINMCAFWIIPWVELITGVLHVCTAEFVFLTNVTSSGWDTVFVTWNPGMLTCVGSFTSFDSAIHMAEEARSAKSAVPKAMFLSIVVNDSLASSTPIVTILLGMTGSTAATTSMATVLFITWLNCDLASIASLSRLTWAWARDAITALGSMALSISYAIAVSSVLYARWSSAGLQLGEWNLGRWGACIHSLALIYTLHVIVFLPFPSTLPFIAANTNHSGPIRVFVFTVAVGLWFVRAKEHWEGPNLTILDFVIAKS
ncbi:hypothetical protein BKA67DRAFT_635765 [Truncatella angustata]|uniref:Choline transport protein n=1 Tax=Truncatella angustata TaxID=152316 RepID=A0A9P8UVA5_9PEZI|nr:uncharacterized protein BKA67DRAFT_635765 [Truncatella angustata]KAH6658665.1 hypothetical protein BKA67DRAFT_635765 [Truncatella angustata]